MFGERLKQLRGEKHLTQRELADMLDVSQQTVAKWELSATTPSPETLVKLARFFTVSTDFLLGVSDGKNENDDDDLLRFALFGTNDNITQEMMEEVKRYAQLQYARHRYEEIVNKHDSENKDE